MEIAPRSFARNAEMQCSFFLLKSFEINQPDQFDLFWLQRDNDTVLIPAAAGLIAM
jgi:hypothetical protein